MWWLAGCIGPQGAATAPPPAVEVVPASPKGGSVHVVVSEDRVRPALREGEVLSHRPLEGALGAAERVVFVVIERGGRFYPLVLAGDARVDGPALHDEWTAFEVPSVLFELVDGAPAAVVLGQCMTGIGPEAAVPFVCNAVVTFDGRAIRRLPEVEERVKGLSRPDEVRRAVQQVAQAR